MGGRVRLLYGDSLLSYRHSADHPLQPARVQDAVRLMARCGLLDGVDVQEPPVAADADLALVHDPAYIDLVRELGERGAASVGRNAVAAGFGTGDNPIFPAMHEAAARVVGASLAGAQAIHAGDVDHAFNPAGGLHHAQRAAASGFCVYNDPAVAIAWLREQGHRVAYVDVDVHHGDGVQNLFYNDPEVLTVSLHESGRYLFPGTGFTAEAGGPVAPRSAVNLPLPPYLWDGPWLEAFEAVVPAALRRFQPTFLVTQDGCDTHLQDPLADLRCSTRLWPHIGRRFHELAHQLCQGRWLATGGGGYAPDVVPRAWTLLFAEMVERPEQAREALDAEAFPPPPDIQRAAEASLEAELTSLGGVQGLQLSRAGSA